MEPLIKHTEWMLTLTRIEPPDIANTVISLTREYGLHIDTWFLTLYSIKYPDWSLAPLMDILVYDNNPSHFYCIKRQYRPLYIYSRHYTSDVECHYITGHKYSSSLEMQIDGLLNNGVDYSLRAKNKTCRRILEISLSYKDIEWEKQHLYHNISKLRKALLQ